MQFTVPAKLIITMPMTEAKVDWHKYKPQIVFALEQHLNNMGVIEYKGDMVDIGAIQFGLRCHIDYEPDEVELTGHDLGTQPTQSAEFEAEATSEEEDAKTD